MFPPTDNYFGGILFNGRYEKSLGACLLDEINILNLIQNKLDFLPPSEKIINGVKIDGGSAAKIALWRDNQLSFGNLPAAGLRNSFGDGDSNFYGVCFYHNLLKLSGKINLLPLQTY